MKLALGHSMKVNILGLTDHETGVLLAVVSSLSLIAFQSWAMVRGQNWDPTNFGLGAASIMAVATGYMRWGRLSMNGVPPNSHETTIPSIPTGGNP